MTIHLHDRPALALVDDDFHSARMLMRMLAAHGAASVSWMAEPEEAMQQLLGMAVTDTAGEPCMIVVDLKASSSATLDFVGRLTREAPDLLVVAMAPSLDRAGRDALRYAGASAVFERHADLSLYRREVASMVGFWVRSQRLDAVGT